MAAYQALGSPVTRDWVRRYLELLNVDHPSVSSDALACLTRAHLRAVPFENVSSVLRRRAHLGRPVPPLDLDALLDAWARGRSGGLCFEVAEMFAYLLVALGYRAYPVLGRITFPGSHQAVLVELDARRYLVDAGNGAPFFEPVPLDGVVEMRRAGLAYRFRPDVEPESWVQDRWIDGAWEPFCRYDLRPADPRIREEAYQRHHSAGQSWVVGCLVLIRCENDEVYKLESDELSHFTPDGKRTERVSGAATYARLAAEVFRMPALPINEGIKALADLAGSSAT